MSVDVPGQAGAISIEVGSNHGTLLVGNHNVVHVSGVTAPVLQPRAPADVHRPVEPEGFLDRRVETAQALAGLRAGEAVEIHGASRIGKSFLLRHAATAAAAAFPDGALLLPPGLAGARDVLQSLFEIFWQSTPDSAPSPTRLRELLAGKRALVAVDQGELSEQDLHVVFDAARGCSLLVTGAAPRFTSAAVAIELGGLPADDALQLWERTRGAPLEPARAAEVLGRIAALGGHPQRLIEAARASGAVVPRPEPQEEDARAVLETLRAFAPRAVPRSLLAELSGVPAAAALADRLAAQGLVHAQAGEADAMLTAAAGDARERSQLQAAGLVRLGELATANPSRRRHALRALPLLWAALAHAGMQPGTVIALGKAWHAPLALAGRWDAWGRMLDSILGAARASGDLACEAWALHQAGTRCLGLGAHEAARTLFQQSLQLRGSDSALQAATRHHLDLLAKLLPPVSMPPPPPPPPPPRRWLKPAAIAGAMGVGSAGAWWVWSAPRLELETARLEFEPTVLGQPGEPARKTLMLRNAGRRAAQLGGARADPPFSVQSDCAAQPLPGGASCALHVAFVPTARGEATGQLLIAAAGVEAASAALAGRALAGDLQHAAQVDFGAMDVGSAPLTRELVLRNAGDAPVNVDAGGVAAPFSVLRDGCKGKPLAAGAQCRVDLRLRVAAAGPVAGELRLRSDAAGQPERRVLLRGEGRAATMELASAELDFGAIEVGTRSATQALRIRNGGSAALKLAATLAEGTDAPFVVTPGSCESPVAPGQSCELYLAFAPTAARRGATQARLDLTAANLPRRSVRLAGTATAAVPLLAPAALEFGTVAWPLNRLAPPERQLRLTNLGDAPLRQPDVAVSAPQFRVVGNDCPQALAPNASCRLTLRFDPNAGGKTFTGALRVSAKNATPASTTAQLSAATRLAALGPPVLREPADGVVIDCGSQRLYPVTFRWQQVEGDGISYRVDFGSGNVVAAQGTSLQRAVPCPGRLGWRVQAVAADGRHSESGMRTLQLRRAAPAPTPAPTPAPATQPSPATRFDASRLPILRVTPAPTPAPTPSPVR